MWERCTNPNNSHYPQYGGRGIKVDPRWKDFSTFYADMGERPEGKTLDRFPDINGNYEPGNCRWATSKEQSRNTQRSRKITWKGETKSLIEWAESLGITGDALSIRIDRWDLDKAMTTPKFKSPI